MLNIVTISQRRHLFFLPKGKKYPKLKFLTEMHYIIGLIQINMLTEQLRTWHLFAGVRAAGIIEIYNVLA